MRNTLKAYERLKREQHIETLFRKGKAFSVFPLRLVYLLVPRPDNASPVQAGFSVSKKKFRHSVDRQRVKRLMREAWRTNKHGLYAAIPPDKQLHVFLIFTDATLPDLPKVTKALVKGINNLITMQAPQTTQS